MTKRGWAIVAVSIALMGVCTLSIATLWTTIGSAQAGKGGWRLFGFSRVSVSTHETASHRVSESPRLVIVSSGGGITVTTGASGVIEVETVKTARGATAEDARGVLAELHVGSALVGGTLTLTFDQPEDKAMIGDGERSSVGFNVRVPATAAVDLTTSEGAVNLSGVSGAVDVNTNFGDVTVRQIAGDLPVSISSDFGAITLEHVDAGAITLRVSFGEISVNDVTATEVNVSTDNGGINVEDGRFSGALLAHSGFGGIDVSRVAARSYDLSSENGSVAVSGSSGPLTLASSFGNIDVADAKDAVLDLQTSNGAISFAGTLNAAGPHKASSDFGSINVSVPESSRFDVLMETDFGSVESDLPVLIRGAAANNRLEGTVGGGGGLLTLTSSNGSVRLNRLSASTR